MKTYQHTPTSATFTAVAPNLLAALCTEGWLAHLIRRNPDHDFEIFVLEDDSIGWTPAYSRHAEFEAAWAALIRAPRPVDESEYEDEGEVSDRERFCAD